MINTSPTDYEVVEHMALQRFDGRIWRQLKVD
jgi:hypothetical protein